MKTILRLGLLLGILSTGCLYDYTVPPDYYRASLSTHAVAAAKLPEEFPAELDVDSCLRYVLARNPAIELAQADTRMAEAGVDIGLSYIIPKVKLEAANTWYDDNPYAGYGYNKGALFTASLSAQYLLYDFGISRYLLAQRYYDTDAARAGVKATSDGLVFGAAQLFFTVKAMEQDLAAMDESQRMLEAQVGDAQALVRAGRIPESQALTLQVALEDLKYNRIALDNTRYKALLSLKNMMNWPLGTQVSLKEPERGLPSAALPAGDELVRLAFLRRPEILAGQSAIRGAEQGLEATRAMRWPLFLVGADMTYSDLEMETLKNGGVNTGAMVTMSWDLYTGGESQANISIERAKLRKAQLYLKQTRDRVREEVLAARADVIELQKQGVSLDLAVVSAEKNLKDLQALYGQQKARASELVAAQASLLNARSQRSKARYALLTALYALEKGTAASLPELMALTAPAAAPESPENSPTDEAME